MPQSFRAAAAVALALLVVPAAGASAASPKSPAPKAAAAKPAAAKPAAKGGAAVPAAAGDTIATILGRGVTRADLGPAPTVLDQLAGGDAAKRQALEDRWEGQALAGLVLGMLLDLYASEHEVQATPAELSELLLLAAQAAREPEAVKAGATPPDTSDVRYRQAGAGVVARFKVNAAIYQEYGGAVLVDPQAGPMPLGSYRRFLEAKEKAGVFAVSPAWKERFWATLTIAPDQPVVPEAEAPAMMRTPWWRQAGD